MSASIAVILLAALLCVSIIQFLNELYYRKRISMLGVIVFVSAVYLMWYLHSLNGDILDLVEKLSQYQIVTLPKGS